MRVFASCSWLRPASTALCLALAAPGLASAQGNPEPLSFKFNTGQNVQPVFEGWSRNPDGSYAMWFGYVNRNYLETPSIPVGPDNKFEPGEADRNQPTFFETRIHHELFSVTVPKDWGPRQELVWTLTLHGQTDHAVAWLQPEWEIDPVRHGKQDLSDEQRKNTAPALTLEGASTVALPNTLSLAVAVQDDGLPTPKKESNKPAVGQETPPTLKPDPDQPEIPVNVPVLPAGGRGQQPSGLVVSWVQWRGPAKAEIEPPAIEAKDGKAVATATFTKAGTYVFRTWANDGDLKTFEDLTVTVSGSPRP